MKTGKKIGSCNGLQPVISIAINEIRLRKEDFSCWKS